MAWPAFRTPQVSGRIGLWPHVVAICGAIALTLCVGAALSVLGVVIERVDGQGGNLPGILGFSLLLSPIASWMGHLPGAVILHLAHRHGVAGWMTALGATLGIGAAIAAFFDAILPLFFAPPLGMVQALLLNRMLTGKVPARQDHPGTMH